MNTIPTQLTATPPTTPDLVIDERHTRSARHSGRVIGALFLAGFLTYGTGGILTTSILDAGDVVGSVAAHQTAFVLGAVLMLTVAVVEIGKAVLFFPLLGQPGRRTALAYLAGILVEVTLMGVGVVALLSLVPLSAQVQAGRMNADLGQALGTFAVDVNGLAYQSSQAAVAVGAFLLTVFLFQARMAPRFLALWGAVGYVLHFAGAVAELFAQHISMFLLIPGGLFEVSFAIWLLVRGLAAHPGRSSQHT